MSPKRLIASAMSLSLMLTMCASTVFAATNNQLDDAAKQLAPTATVADLNEIYSLKPNQSCADLEQQLEEYLDRVPYYPIMYKTGGGMMPVNDAMPMAETAVDASASSSYAGDAAGQDLSDFSQTNIQVTGVDEGDVLKTTKTHLYYYNQKTQHVDIIALDPTQKGVLDVTTVEVAGSIAIPSIFANNVNLYVHNNQLVITSQWYPQYKNNRARDDVTVEDLFDQNSLTLVITYDITNPAKTQLTKLTALPGTYNDARLIDNELVLITDIFLDVYRFRQAKEEKKKTELFDGLSDALPREVSFVRKPAVKGDYEMINDRINCADLSLSLPDSETIEQFGYDATVSLISRINLDAPSAPATKHGIIGRNNQLHMARDYLYLTDQIWMNNRRTCPADAACFFAGYDQGAYTVIHKLDHNAGTRAAIRYIDSTIVPGGSLTQYSMMQNADGNFQIITQGNRRGDNNKTKGTHVHILDQQMNIIGSLMGIEPEEDFKSSRFIGDKLYLVTFEQIDPLFVVDLVNPRKPTIIGELKIPGYSTYLHPHSPLSDGVQYILGLGYDTKTNKNGGVTNAGIKIDLYKIDYNDRIGKAISVKQIGTKTLGRQGSASEATHNPRVFVRNAAKQELTLPLFLSNGYPPYNKKDETDPAYFAGYKVFAIHTNGEINEKLSRNFVDILRKTLKSERNDSSNYNSYLSSRNWEQSKPRVGYIDETSYVITNDFAEWFDRRAKVSKMLTFAKKSEKKKETK